MTSVDHFARFGLPVGYAVDAKALDAAYERLSFELHPDFLAAAPPDEKARAQQASAELNEAYRVLRSEPERAAYLLGLLAAGKKLNLEALPANFLQEMFLLQEEVEEATQGDQNRAAADAIRTQVETRHRDTLAERARLFAEAASGTKAGDNLQTIQSNLNQERYLLRLLGRLNGGGLEP